MRIEKLNDDNIKVTLTTSDLINLDIDVNTLSPDSKELHTFLFHIMETIREETGFNPYKGQVVVEASPSRDGMSIMIRRMCTSGKKITREQFKKAVGVNAKLKQTAKPRLFYFSSFDDLCAAMLELGEDELLSCRLYKLNSTYCFVVENNDKFSRCLSVMSEFSARQSEHPMQMNYIKEHGCLVAKGSDLVNMTDRIRNLT